MLARCSLVKTPCGSSRSRTSWNRCQPGYRGAEHVGAGVVPLAPVRSPVKVEHQLLHGMEVLRPFGTDVLVHRDVAGLAAVRRRQQRVVGGSDPDLDRERHGQVQSLDQGQHPAHGFGQHCPRDRPLRLGEPHPAVAREHPVAVIEPLAARRQHTGRAGPVPGSREGTADRSAAARPDRCC